MRTTIKSRTSSKYSPIRPDYAEVASHERLEKSHIFKAVNWQQRIYDEMAAAS